MIRLQLTSSHGHLNMRRTYDMASPTGNLLQFPSYTGCRLVNILTTVMAPAARKHIPFQYINLVK
jgi:hypothetical protein